MKNMYILCILIIKNYLFLNVKTEYNVDELYLCKINIENK
jgi:hypothetical protein